MDALQPTILALVNDIGLLALMVLVAGTVRGRYGEPLDPPWGDLVMGLAFGAMASLVMLQPIPLPHGAVTDPRAGPLGAAVAAALGAATRYFVVGGPIALGGVVSFALYGLAGALAGLAIARRGLALDVPVLAGIALFGTLAVATAVTILAPSLAMPPASYFEPTMKPVIFCRKTRGMRRWSASSMKCAAFCALSENKIPLLARIATGMP
jgi:hypothetical protein